MNNTAIDRAEQPVDSILEQKKQLESQCLAFEQVLNEMIHDLSNDHPDLVTKANQQQPPPEKKQLTDADAKEIWRYIANKCHPDKNNKKDQVLHDVFLRAKKHKEEGSIPDLYFCYLELVEYTQENSLLAKMLRNSDVIKESMETLRKRYDYMKNSFFGQLLVLYKVDRFQASKQYRNYLVLKTKGEV